MNDIKNITVDDIKRLRAEGKTGEALELLKAFRESGKKNIKEGRKLQLNKKNKIRTFILKKNNICITCGKEPALENKSRCEKCYKYHREYNKQYYSREHKNE